MGTPDGVPGRRLVFKRSRHRGFHSDGSAALNPGKKADKMENPCAAVLTIAGESGTRFGGESVGE